MVIYPNLPPHSSFSKNWANHKKYFQFSPENISLQGPNFGSCIAYHTSITPLPPSHETTLESMHMLAVERYTQWKYTQHHFFSIQPLHRIEAHLPWQLLDLSP